MKLSTTIYMGEHPLTLEGHYSPFVSQTPWQPSEQAEFEITNILLNKVSVMELLQGLYLQHTTTSTNGTEIWYEDFIEFLSDRALETIEPEDLIS